MRIQRGGSGLEPPLPVYFMESSNIFQPWTRRRRKKKRRKRTAVDEEEEEEEKKEKEEEEKERREKEEEEEINPFLFQLSIMESATG